VGVRFYGLGWVWYDALVMVVKAGVGREGLAPGQAEGGILR
jgi:hypothetical protein